MININKIAYILGGSGEIGTEITNSFLSVFDKVIVLDIKKPKLVKKNLTYIKFNCSKLNSIEKNLNIILKKYGIPNVFVNCSYPTTKDWINCNFKKVKIKSFIENLNLHLISYCWTSKIMADQMKKKKKSSIILLGSIYGVVAQDPKIYSGTKMSENFVYPIIKAGIISHTKQMAVNYGKYNLNVNCISPGGIEGKVKGLKTKQNTKFKNRYISKVPLKRFCKSTDVAELCLFLSQDKNSYITGQNIVLDGGFTLI